MRGKIITGMFVAAIAVVLFGCAQVATSGAQMVYNRHSLEKSFGDQYITLKATQALNKKNGPFKNANITVATTNGEVLLAGQVPEAWQREKAEEIVQSIPNVKHVYNTIKVSLPTPTLKRVSDAWLTTKVKAKLIASEDVDGSQVKVVTENGTVYLMGALPPEEAQAAIDIARNTDGVESVVKMFSYVHISKT